MNEGCASKVLLVATNLSLSKMYKVLVPVDEDVERAKRAAEVVSNLPYASESVEVSILNVLQEFEVSDEYGRTDSEDLYDEKDIPKSAVVISDYFEDQDISASLQRKHGDPAEEIIDVADELDADAIVMGGRKRSPVSKVVFGSVAQDTLLKANRPVTIISVD